MMLSGCGGEASAQGSTSAGAPAPVPAAPAPATPAGVTKTEWRPLRIGAGGYVTGMDIAPDGTKVCRCDTYGAYIWDNTAAEWKSLVTTASMPAGQIGHDQVGEQGVYEVAIAPSDTNRIYMVFNGSVYKSVNKGQTFAKTALAQFAASPNDEFRTLGRKMVVDPVNPDVVYVGTKDKGLAITTDGGATWRFASDVPTATTAAGVIVAIDRSLGTAGGRTRGVYVSSYGKGIYQSTDGGSSFSAVPGAPAENFRMICDQTGALWMTSGGSSANVNRFKAGKWEAIPAAGSTQFSIAVNPADAKHIVTGSSGGIISQSFDGGVSWTGEYWPLYPVNSGRRVATDVPWLAWTSEGFMSNGDMVFDPSATNKLYFAEGIGVWYANPPVPPTSFSGFDWNSQSKGIEQLVSNRFISPPGGTPLYFTWDRPVFKIDDPDVFPKQHGPNNKYSIVMGWGGDYAIDDPNFVVGLMNWWEREESAYSTDGGTTWTKFATSPSGWQVGGSIAVSTKDNIVWISSNNGKGFYTKDRGKTWDLLPIPGIPTTGDTGWGWAYYLNRKIVAADKVTPGTFYAYNTAQMGLYRSTNGGTDWTRVYDKEIAPASIFNATLTSVPGKAGHLFFTSGNQGGVSPAPSSLMRSTDGGVTWTAVKDALEVYDVGFGKAAPGSDYPAIYIAGYIKNVWGVYRSDDNTATWVNIGDYPNGNGDMIKTISGDMNVYGRVYVGFTGSGAAVADLKTS